MTTPASDVRANQSLILGIASLVFAVMFAPMFPVTLVMAVLAIRRGRPDATGKGSPTGVALGWTAVALVGLELAFVAFVVTLLMTQ